MRFEEPRAEAAHDAPGKVDLGGTIRVVAAVPGLFALILFASFNNFLGGVFMALMDAYGLSLMAVQHWGLLWACVSCAFIVSGIVIARTGLGKSPLRTLLFVNLIMWSVAAIFTHPVVDSAARGGLLRLDVPRPLCRGGRADHAAEGRAL